MSKQFTEILYYIKKYLAFHFQENGEKKQENVITNFITFWLAFVENICTSLDKVNHPKNAFYIT